MRGIAGAPELTCARCWRPHGALSPLTSWQGSRNASNAAPSNHDANSSTPTSKDASEQDKVAGAMSRRLSQMSEENIETAGRSAVKAVQEADFSEGLKKRLLDKLADAQFKNEHPAALAQVSMPSSAGKGTRDNAAATPWSGQEATHDTALRMLDDARKPMRVPTKPPIIRGPRGAPTNVDTGRPKHRVGSGVRIASARDQASSYEVAKASGLSEEERQKFREAMKARFQPGARAIAASIQGLASLANERIEDAIARGQFKNLPRGKRLERDHNANSPFIDTTEYLMNKMIQKQDIVPPWIEKQQELMSTASRFRGRLRADWRRHVARVISSNGGSLEKQMRLAEDYALAEAIENPSRKTEVKLNAVDASGRVSQISLAGELKVIPPSVTSADEEDAKVENEIKIMEQTFNDDGSLRSDLKTTVIMSVEGPNHQANAVDPEATAPRPTVRPFRDPQWEETERAYLTAAVDNLNSLARSYNLMAPSIARKPYYYLDRELKACFADVAPQIASTIRERAFAPKVKGVETTGGKAGGLLEQFSTSRAGHVHNDTKPMYGFKEFWRDLFAGSKT